MKNLDLNAYGVVAMPKQEMQKMDGGSVIAVIALWALRTAGGYLLTDIVGNPKSATQAFQKGCDSAPTFDTMRNPF